jgi:subtilisin
MILCEEKIFMPSGDANNQLLANEGLNFTPISSANIFDTQSSNFSSNSSDATTADYNSNSGYGLVDAAKAVSKAAGQNTYSDVADLGGNNWGADLVKAPEAWTNGYTGQGIVVAVVDTGVDYNHLDLKNNIWTNSKEIAGNGIDDDGNSYVDDTQGWNFASNNNNTLDDNGHGTHVSGTIAGENNDSGVTGIAYNAKIMPVKVLNESGSGSYDAIANGIYYAVNNGANVINLSLGGDFPNGTLESAIKYASNKGVIVVMAAGNNGYPITSYPASYADKWGIAVGAVDKNNNLADFSNRPGLGQLAYVTAPGVKVYSSVPGDKYATYSGTSMAAPHVAGVVALMLSANPTLTDAQVRQIITETAGSNSTQAASSGFNLNPVVTVVNSTVSDFSSITSQNFADIVVNNTLTKAFSSNSSWLTESNLTAWNSKAISILESVNPGLGSQFGSNLSWLTESNLTTWSSKAISTLESVSPVLGSQFLYYQDILASSVNNIMANNPQQDNNLDINKIITQLQKQFEDYQKWFGR